MAVITKIQHICDKCGEVIFSVNCINLTVSMFRGFLPPIAEKEQLLCESCKKKELEEMARNFKGVL